MESLLPGYRALEWIISYNRAKCYSFCSLRKQPTFCNATKWFSGEMTSEKRAQKFNTDDVSLPRSGECIWLAGEKFRSMHDRSEELPRSFLFFFFFNASTQMLQPSKINKYYPDLGSDTSTVWNFCSCSILRSHSPGEPPWWRLKM